MQVQPTLQAVLDENLLLKQKVAVLLETVALLRDEIAGLKGHKPRPKSRAAT